MWPAPGQWDVKGQGTTGKDYFSLSKETPQEMVLFFSRYYCIQQRHLAWGWCCGDKAKTLRVAKHKIEKLWILDHVFESLNEPTLEQPPSELHVERENKCLYCSSHIELTFLFLAAESILTDTTINALGVIHEGHSINVCWNILRMYISDSLMTAKLHRSIQVSVNLGKFILQNE